MKQQQKKLNDLYQQLDEADARTLLRFAEFLAAQPVTAVNQTTADTGSGNGSAESAAAVTQSPEIPKPESIPRPQQETVVAALKRLSTTYPMLDKSVLLHQASALVAEHVMGGRPAREVIDEIELIFRRAYDKFVELKRTPS